MDDSLPELGDLEREVMQLVWAHGPLTAEDVRERLSRRLKESTVRTVLRRLGNASSTGSATVPSKRSWLAGWIAQCSTNASCACSPTRLPRPRRRPRRSPGKRKRRREGKSDAGYTGGVGAALLAARQRRVDWPISFPGPKSARADDILGHRAGGVAGDAALDALDHGDHHLEPFAGPGAGKLVAGQESVAGAIGRVASVVGARRRRRGARRDSRGHQLVAPGDGDLRLCRRDAVAE